MIKNIMGVPKSVANQVWLSHNGKTFSAPCKCCTTDITVFDYFVARVIPQPKGTKDEIINLLPVCKQCFTGARTGGLLGYKANNFPTKSVAELCSAISRLSESETSEIVAYVSGISPRTEVPIKAHKHKSKAESERVQTGTCTYVFTRGPREGKTCEYSVYDGGELCSKCRSKKAKHSKTETVVSVEPTSESAATESTL